jgi:hypothetical protein
VLGGRWSCPQELRSVNTSTARRIFNSSPSLNQPGKVIKTYARTAEFSSIETPAPGEKTSVEKSGGDPLHTEPQKMQFKEVFAKRRKNQIMLAALILPLILVVVFSEDRGAGTILGYSMQEAGPLFFGVVLAAVIFSFRNWRCPSCSKYLGRNINPKFCHNCGVELRN